MRHWHLIASSLLAYVLMSSVFEPLVWGQSLVHLSSQQFGDVDSDAGLAVAVDGTGSVVVTGQFRGAVNFGGGVLSSAGGDDVFVAKFDTSGVHIWSKRFGDSGTDEGLGVAVDSSGGVLVTGAFFGAVDFGGGVLTSASSRDIFVAKYDPDGNHIWSQRFGDTSSDDRGHAVAVDGADNVFVTGSFQGSVDFGGGPLTSISVDLFVAKFDTDGNHIWSKKLGDTSNEVGLALAIDESNNVVVTGKFGDTVDFGGGSLTSAGSDDGFVAKYDSIGNHLWSRRFGDSGVDWGRSVAVDVFDNVFATGSFTGTVDFGGGPLVGSVSIDIFVVKYDPDGNHLWSRGIAGSRTDLGNGIAVDAAGNVFMTGRFENTVNFGGGPLTSAGDSEIFVAGYNTSGTYIWSRRFGDAANDWGEAIALDAVGNIIVTGFFADTVDFGGGLLTSTGSIDIFLARFTPVGIGPRSDLVVSTLVIPSEMNDGSVVYPISFTVHNVGVLDAGPFRASVYLSTDSIISIADSVVASVNLSGLAFGADSVVTMTTIMPGNPRGLVFLGVFVDDLDSEEEYSGSNNTLADSSLYQVPLINSVVDVPNDQGGQAFLSWFASPLDAVQAGGLITDYTLWRTIDVTLKTLQESDAILIRHLSEWERGSRDQIVCIEQSTQGPVFWENIATHGAFHFDAYGMALPTLFDSTASSFDWHYWRVVAHTSDNLVFYISATDSGYSMDNLAPGVPQGFAAAYNTGSGNQLSWSPATEPDFQYFRIYRDTDPNFTPGPGNLVDATTAAGWTDPSFDGGNVYYKITAVDFSGNESDPASPGTATAINEPTIPTRFALYQNVPNPFNPTTKIGYDVADRGGVVTLRIYDVSGRLIRTLVERVQPPGQKTATWNGRDDRGNRVATGVYFYRLTAPGFEKTRRMVFLK